MQPSRYLRDGTYMYTDIIQLDIQYYTGPHLLYFNVPFTIHILSQFFSVYNCYITEYLSFAIFISFKYKRKKNQLMCNICTTTLDFPPQRKFLNLVSTRKLCLKNCRCCHCGKHRIYCVLNNEVQQLDISLHNRTNLELVTGYCSMVLAAHHFLPISICNSDIRIGDF